MDCDNEYISVFLLAVYWPPCILLLTVYKYKIVSFYDQFIQLFPYICFYNFLLITLLAWDALIINIRLLDKIKCSVRLSKYWSCRNILEYLIILNSRFSLVKYLCEYHLVSRQLALFRFSSFTFLYTILFVTFIRF